MNAKQSSEHISLKNEDKILNLKEIQIYDLNILSGSYCSGPVSFTTSYDTEHGYCEDPRFIGKIRILKTQKIKKNIFILKIQTDFEDYY